MRIDAHQHFWNYDPVRDSWIDDSMKLIRKNFLPKDLKPVLQKNNIDGCIAVQADESEEENLFLLELADRNNFIKGVVAWLDLCAENIEEKLDYFSKYQKLVGLRHVVQKESSDFMLREDFQRGISKLEKYGLTYDILVFPPQLPAAIELVQNFPKQAFVLDHIAKPYIKEGRIDQWKRDMETLAQSQNIYCKVSGMLTEADWDHWKKEDFTKYLEVIFNAFGINRILYGSDWPVCLLAGKYHEQLNILEDFIVKLPSKDRARIMGENAIQFYNLKL